MISHLCWSLSNISLYFSSVHTLVSLSDLVKPSLSHSRAPYSTLLLPISVFGSPPCFINTVGTFDYNFLNFHISNINIHKSHISSFSSLKNEVWEFPHPVQKQSFPCVPWPTPTPITSWTLALKFPPISQTILSIQALSFATTVMLESLHCFKVLQKTPPLRTCPLETTFFSSPCRSKTAGSTKLFTNSLLFRRFLLTLQSTISDFTLFISQIELLVRSALVSQMQRLWLFSDFITLEPSSGHTMLNTCPILKFPLSLVSMTMHAPGSTITYLTHSLSCNVCHRIQDWPRQV